MHLKKKTWIKTLNLWKNTAFFRHRQAKSAATLKTNLRMESATHYNEQTSPFRFKRIITLFREAPPMCALVFSEMNCHVSQH